jgi:hypothetical protein
LTDVIDVPSKAGWALIFERDNDGPFGVVKRYVEHLEVTGWRIGLRPPHTLTPLFGAEHRDYVGGSVERTLRLVPPSADLQAALREEHAALAERLESLYRRPRSQRV